MTPGQPEGMKPSESETEALRMQYASRGFLVAQCRDYRILLEKSRADLATLRAALNGAEESLQVIQCRAQKNQFDTGAIARGTVQVIRGLAEDALVRLRELKP